MHQASPLPLPKGHEPHTVLWGCPRPCTELSHRRWFWGHTPLPSYGWRGKMPSPFTGTPSGSTPSDAHHPLPDTHTHSGCMGVLAAHTHGTESTNAQM